MKHRLLRDLNSDCFIVIYIKSRILPLYMIIKISDELYSISDKALVLSEIFLYHFCILMHYIEVSHL